MWKKKTDVILVCKNLHVNSNTFSSAQTGKTYFATKNKQRFSCNSTNVVYLVHCKKCNLQYVGSTTTEFKVSTGTTNHLWKLTKKIDWFVSLFVYYLFYLFCCFVLTVHSPLFFRKIVEIVRIALQAAILNECQNYLEGRGGLEESENIRGTVL